MNGGVRPCFPWVGGKEKLLPYLRQVIPPNICQFVDVFGGSAAVILGMPPAAGRLDIYNDLDTNLSNFFLCAREKPLALIEEIRKNSFLSRDIYTRNVCLLADGKGHKELYEKTIQGELSLLGDRSFVSEEYAAQLRPLYHEQLTRLDAVRAALFFVTIHGSYNAIYNSYGVAPLNLRKFEVQVHKVCQRMQSIAVENKNAFQIIKERARPGGVLYFDPPYYQAEKLYTVVREQQRKKDRRKRNKEGLRRMLRFHIRLWRYATEAAGYVILSYNDCPFIRKLYQDQYILAFRRGNPLSQTAGAEYGELIITNYDPRPFLQSQLTLFDRQLPKGEMELVNIPAKRRKMPKGRKELDYKKANTAKRSEQRKKQCV